MKYRILQTIEFKEWLNDCSVKEKAQIASRIEKIISFGHFGTVKNLDFDLWELKWINGRRIYYTYIEHLNILLLLGGNKNGQDKDIAKARKILAKRIKN